MSQGENNDDQQSSFGSRAHLTVTEPDGSVVYDLVVDRLSVGRSAESDIWLRSPFVSKQHAVLERAVGTFRFLQVGRTNPTFLNGQPVTDALLHDGDELLIGLPDGPHVLLVFHDQRDDGRTARATRMEGRPGHGNAGAMVRAQIPQGGRLTIGRGPNNDLILPSMLVSREHAEISRAGNDIVLRDRGSSNGTFLNEVQVREEVLGDGDSIRIGSYRLIFDEGAVRGFNEERTVRIDALEVGKTIGDNTILTGISMSAFPGELVAIVGASGSGKTTFMDALNGVRPATSGTVLVNGVDLYKRFDSVRPLMGYVPQFSILHDELPLERALYYTGRLRFADDVSDADVWNKVREVMTSLQIDGRARVRMGRLSGGRRKRASLAAELLTEPGLLFLDEPTTGLDAGLTRRLVESFRGLANEGRTVILVTHDTESLELCDIILFLMAGRLIYVGPPRGAAEYFGVKDLGEVYSRVERESDLGTWNEKCRASANYAKYVGSRQAGLSPTPQRSSVEHEPPPMAPGTGNVGLSGLRQFAVLVRRFSELMLRDPRTLALLLLQAPILALLLNLISQKNGFVFPPGFDQEHQVPDEFKKLVVPSLPLLMAASVTWFGAINAAREIVKEVPIFRRERLAGLKALPYLMSKVTVLGLLCVVQATLFFLVILSKIDIPSDGVILPGPAEVYVTLILTSFASLGLGLLISALSPNPDRAQSLVPIILIPQLIFARVGSDVSKPVQILAYSSISRWAFQAMGATGNIQSGDFGHSTSYIVGRWAGLALISVGLLAVTGVLLWRRNCRLETVMPRKGSVLGKRYEVLEQIGSGGFGTVFKARDNRSGRLVAVKVLHQHLAEEPQYLKRFHREIIIARSLSSPHIVRVLASGDDEGLHYMVMEFVDGLVLRDILRTHDRLTTEEALAVALDVVSALDEAHQRGVVHRDVKPHNIFVTRAGVKLGDFGIARADDLTAVTVHAGYLGTIAYGSPSKSVARSLTPVRTSTRSVS